MKNLASIFYTFFKWKENLPDAPFKIITCMIIHFKFLVQNSWINLQYFTIIWRLNN